MKLNPVLAQAQKAKQEEEMLRKEKKRRAQASEGTGASYYSSSRFSGRRPSMSAAYLMDEEEGMYDTVNLSSLKKGSKGGRGVDREKSRAGGRKSKGYDDLDDFIDRDDDDSVVGDYLDDDEDDEDDDDEDEEIDSEGDGWRPNKTKARREESEYVVSRAFNLYFLR
jgi:hypothetical protein